MTDLILRCVIQVCASVAGLLLAADAWHRFEKLDENCIATCSWQWLAEKGDATSRLDRMVGFLNELLDMNLPRTLAY